MFTLIRLNQCYRVSTARTLSAAGRAKNLLLEDAFTLFKRLGVDVRSISAREFTTAYFALAKRYHPDRGDQKTHDLMANINAARTAILRCRRMV
jgi:hypothetical protein